MTLRKGDLVQCWCECVGRINEDIQDGSTMVRLTEVCGRTIEDHIIQPKGCYFLRHERSIRYGRIYLDVARRYDPLATALEQKFAP